jgi:hypothetical protein
MEVRVCSDMGDAVEAARAGAAVVLLGPDAGALGQAARTLRAACGGRVAVFVGDPADPAVRVAAAELAAEQFARADPPGAATPPVDLR